MSRALVRLRAKTLRVARMLEQHLGTPRQQRSLPPPLDMLIATILSQNTNDKNSFRAYTALRKRFPTWQDVAAAPMAGIKAAIKSGGMANQKALRIKETLAAVKARYGTYSLSALRKKSNDEIIEELVSLNGVGFKTAACVLLFSLGRDVFPVDTHVHRICNRLGLVPNTPTPEKTFEVMKRLVPAGRGYSFHTNLIRFGRMVCRSAKPRCAICPLYDECVFENKARWRNSTGLASRSGDYDFMLLDNVR
jgi:endonuclease-3